MKSPIYWKYNGNIANVNKGTTNINTNERLQRKKEIKTVTKLLKIYNNNYKNK